MCLSYKVEASCDNYQKTRAVTAWWNKCIILHTGLLSFLQKIIGYSLALGADAPGMLEWKTFNFIITILLMTWEVLLDAGFLEYWSDNGGCVGLHLLFRTARSRMWMSRYIQACGEMFLGYSWHINWLLRRKRPPCTRPDRKLCCWLTRAKGIIDPSMSRWGKPDRCIAGMKRRKAPGHSMLLQRYWDMQQIRPQNACSAALIPTHTYNWKCKSPVWTRSNLSDNFKYNRLNYRKYHNQFTITKVYITLTLLRVGRYAGCRIRLACMAWSHELTLGVLGAWRWFYSASRVT